MSDDLIKQLRSAALHDSWHNAEIAKQTLFSLAADALESAESRVLALQAERDKAEAVGRAKGIEECISAVWNVPVHETNSYRQEARDITRRLIGEALQSKLDSARALLKERGK